MKRRGSAVWQGTLRDGSGTVSTESGVLNASPYSFGTRFGAAPGTNPEELVAAAHAGCFSMALSLMLGEAGLPPTRIATTATATLEKTDAGFTVTAIHLDVAATVPGADPATFATIAGKAKAGCVISRLLNATITMDAQLTP